ncbi:MAG: hypothetical protein U1D55_05825 [Phycisphaerae bacterium]
MFEMAESACGGERISRTRSASERRRESRSRALRVLIVTTLAIAPSLLAQDKPAAPAEKPAASQPAGDLTPVEFKLPKPAFRGTPKDAPRGTNLEKPRSGPRPPFLAPRGTLNLAAGKPVTSSDSEPIVGSLKLVTDGDKEAADGSYVELGPGLQWVQIDLQQRAKLYALLVWRYHQNARIYHDVIIQISDDAEFKKDVKTVFNNDHDNTSKLGVGDDKEFWETYEGRLTECAAAAGRYVRLYSNGSTADDQNHYTEIEVYGLPEKP